MNNILLFISIFIVTLIFITISYALLREIKETIKRIQKQNKRNKLLQSCIDKLKSN